MEKSKNVFFLVVFSIMAVALAFFIGYYVNSKNNTDINNNENIYIDGSGQTFLPDKGDGSSGFVDNDEIEGTTYYLKANNSSIDNISFVKENAKNAENEAFLLSSDAISYGLNAFTTTNLGSSSFVTIERFGNDLGFSNLVYLKFSTYLGSYSKDGDLIKVEPCAVVYGFEESKEYSYNLRYAFCIYGDRGQVVDSFIYQNPLFQGEYSSRVPYLLTSDYTSVNKLFNYDGLNIDDTTYKLLNNGVDQIYCEADVLTCVTSFFKTLLNQYVNTTYSVSTPSNFDMSKYLKIANQEYDILSASYMYKSNILNRESFMGTNGSGEKRGLRYFDYSENIDGYFYSGPTFFEMFNNDKSVYKLPLVDIAV